MTTGKMDGDFRFLAGGGEMGERIRAFDWAQSPLGTVADWPQSLKTSISIMLNSQHPMWIGWGLEMTFLYNDAYVEVLSLAKHPWALGKPAAAVWAEIWDFCGPLADKVFQKGEASFFNDVRLFMNRGDFLEETFYSFSYGPIRIESGDVGGLFCPSAEVTPKVLNTRRLQTLSELAAKSLVEKSTAGACASAATVLAKNPDDIPFALLYLIDGDCAVLEQAVGIQKRLAGLSPEKLELSDSTATCLWPIAEVMRKAQMQMVSLKGFEGFPPGAAGQPLSEALVLPVAGGQERPLAILVAGVSPARRFDENYRTFYELVAGHVATAIQNARAAEEQKRRVEADEKLRESEQRYRTLFDSMAEGFCIAEMIFDDTGKPVDYRFLDVNPAFEKQTGLKDATGKRMRELAPTHEQQWFDIYGHIALTGEPARFENRADALGRWYEVFAARLDPPESRRVGIVFNDVTTRKQSEELLRQNEALFSALIDQAPVGVYVIDAHFRLQQINALALPAFEKVNPRIGRDFGEVMNILWGPELGGEITKIFRHTLATGEPYRSPRFSNFRQDLAAEKSYDWQTQRVTLPDGQHGVVCYFNDITEQIQNEERERRLKEEAEAATAKFRAVFEQTSVFAGIMGLDGTILEANRLCLDACGYRAEEIIGRPFWECGWWSDSEAVQEKIRAATRQAAEGQVYQEELPYTWADGSKHMVAFGLYPIRDESGKVIFLHPTGLDITDGLQARTRSDFLGSLTEKLSVVSDAAEINRIATREIGEFLGGSRCYFFQAISGTDQIQVLPEWQAKPAASLEGTFPMSQFGSANFWQAAKKGILTVSNVHTHPLTQDFAASYEAFDVVSYALAPFIHEGRWVVCVAVCSDQPRQWSADEKALLENVVARVWPLIERARVEGTLREAHALLADKAAHLETLVQQRTVKLRDTIGELEAFSYSIAHDMRAPLRSLQGFSAILLSEHAAKLDAPARGFLDSIARAANRMDRLIQDVLDYSRVVRGDFPLAVIDLEQLVRGILDTYPNLRPEAAEISLVGPFPRVLGNEAMLMQILSNLMGNAVKFVPPGTRPRLKLWTELRAQNVRLFVQDNGIGIAPDQHEKIFGIFQRVDKHYEGTGIGLAIVKKAVQRLGGQIGLQSEPGRGSTFWIEVRRADA